MHLRTENEIISSWCIDKIKVSICCITFNHEKYIAQAIEGFLIQKTTFPFEILIHDDASSDSTAKIIEGYRARYPALIKPIYQKVNQFSKGFLMNETFNFPRAKGEYIALCEGDDFWFDENKLQKQFDFLESNSEFSFCFHAVKQLDETVKHNSYSCYDKLSKSILSSKDVIFNHYIPTLSLFFRSDFYLKDFEGKAVGFRNGDLFLEIFLSTKGLGFFDCLEQGVYRHHDGGITKRQVDYKRKVNDLNMAKKLYSELIGVLDRVYHQDIKLAIALKVYLPLSKVYFKNGNVFLGSIFLFKSFLNGPLGVASFLCKKYLW